MKPILFFLFVFHLFVGNKNTTMSEAKSTVFKGYCTNDKDAWNRGIAALQKHWEENPENGAYLFDLIQSKYGHIGFLMTLGDPGTEKAIDALIKENEQLRKFPEYRSHQEAFHGALLALKIGDNGLRTLLLGPKSDKALKTALKLDAENPQAWVEMGNLRFHAPGIFGGSPSKAIACFAKAIKLYDQYPGQRANNWQYLHAICWMGKALEHEGDYEGAKLCYERALEFAPNFIWAKEELLPAVERKLK